MTPPLTASIDIDAPPRVVRDVYIAFENMKQWHDGSFIKSISRKDGRELIGKELKVGDKLTISLAQGFTFTAEVKINEPELFQWFGGIRIAGGAHFFHFKSVEGDPNKTHFVQEEIFTGVMVLMGYNKPDKKHGQTSLKEWTAFNADLKREAERLWAEQSATQ